MTREGWYTPLGVTEPSPNRGVMIVLAYLWPLALVPLLVEKQDPEIQWHAKHGIVLMIAELILFFAYILVTSIVSLATFGLRLAAMVKGLNGGRLIVPRISDYAARF